MIARGEKSIILSMIPYSAHSSFHSVESGPVLEPVDLLGVEGVVQHNCVRASVSVCQHAVQRLKKRNSGAEQKNNSETKKVFLALKLLKNLHNKQLTTPGAKDSSPTMATLSSGLTSS